MFQNTTYLNCVLTFNISNLLLMSSYLGVYYYRLLHVFNKYLFNKNIWVLICLNVTFDLSYFV